MGERVHGPAWVEVAEETHDEGRGDGEFAFGFDNGEVVAGDDAREGDAAGGVGLGVEEHFGVADVGGVSFEEVGPSKVEEVGWGEEHGHGWVVDGEEGGEVVKLEGLSLGLVGADSGRKGDVITCCEFAHELGFKGSFEVYVQFCFGEAGDEAFVFVGDCHFERREHGV